MKAVEKSQEAQAGAMLCLLLPSLGSSHMCREFIQLPWGHPIRKKLLTLTVGSPMQRGPTTAL